MIERFNIHSSWDKKSSHFSLIWTFCNWVTDKPYDRNQNNKPKSLHLNHKSSLKGTNICIILVPHTVFQTNLEEFCSDLSSRLGIIIVYVRQYDSHFTVHPHQDQFSPTSSFNPSGSCVWVHWKELFTSPQMKTWHIRLHVKLRNQHRCKAKTTRRKTFSEALL